MLLLLVRHGLTPLTGKKLSGWLPGLHLSKEGREQADAAAARIEGIPVKAVYSSPLERCRETAQPIAQKHGLDVSVLEGMGEVKYGDWQGKTFKSLYRTKGWEELRRRPADFRFPGGESIREAQTRGVAMVEKLLQAHRGDAIVVVSHADLVRLIVAAYLGLSLDLYQRMVVAPASVSAISFEDVPRLLRLADTGSLDNLTRRMESIRKSESPERIRSKKSPSPRSSRKSRR